MDADTPRIDPAYETDGRPMRDSRSIGDLLKELRDETTALLRQEVALAKTEVTEKATKAGRNIAYLAVGGAIAYAGLLFLLLGVTMLVTWALIALGMNENLRYLAYCLAPLIVGGAVAGVGYALIQKAISTFSQPQELVPQKTVDSLQENASWAKNKVTA